MTTDKGQQILHTMPEPVEGRNFSVSTSSTTAEYIQELVDNKK